jgi:hypothetical protein
VFLLLHQAAKHRWFSGRMLACHAGGPGSIPGRCSMYFSALLPDSGLFSSSLSLSFSPLVCLSVPPPLPSSFFSVSRCFFAKSQEIDLKIARKSQVIMFKQKNRNSFLLNRKDLTNFVLKNSKCYKYHWKG